MFPAKIFPAEIFPQFVQTQHSRTLPTDQKSKSRRPPGRCYTQHAPRPLRAHPTQLTQNTRRSACSSAPSNHPRPFGCKNNAHRRSSNGGTGSNAIARLCLARPTFLNHFCKLMLRDGRCRLHNKINRALALMKCPGNEYLEGGTEPCCHHCLRCSEERSA
jgi:hypothetical protein